MKDKREQGFGSVDPIEDDFDLFGEETVAISGSVPREEQAGKSSKRGLFLALGGVVLGVLILGGGFFAYQQLSARWALQAELQAIAEQAATGGGTTVVSQADTQAQGGQDAGQTGQAVQDGSSLRAIVEAPPAQWDAPGESQSGEVVAAVSSQPQVTVTGQGEVSSAVITVTNQRDNDRETRLRQAADTGEPEAMFALAQYYDQAARPDYARAAQWYRRAGEAGIPAADYRLGEMLREGRGVARSDSDAFDAFLRAGQSGHDQAQLEVGRAYRRGFGVDADPVLAANWFQIALGNGMTDAALELGKLFEEGVGEGADYDAALGWYQYAARSGVIGAQAEADRLVAQQGALPREAERPLSAQEIAEVQALLNQLGFTAGPADGQPGPRTRQAINAFSQSRGDATQVIDRSLLRSLRAAAREAAS
ncbi:MAG: SEL1-like repeat protein [Pseudomonadota bacterium]